MEKDHSTYIAHIKEANGQKIVHPLKEHLLSVAELTQKFSKKFHAAGTGYLAGLWHDLGKYQKDFQERIRKLSDYDVDDEDTAGYAPKVDHSSAGGLLAAKKIGPQHPITYAILGHHCGLQDREDVISRLERKKDLLNLALQNADRQIKEPCIKEEKLSLKAPCDVTFFYRMLFSALVDADRLDTERFFDPQSSSLRSGYWTLEQYNKKLEEHLNKIISEVEKTPVNELRKRVLEEVTKKAGLEPGFFSLTVPTGGGKTLTSLSFALKHALIHKKDRVIYAIPYTSIIEQNAQVFADIFGRENVFEHHSAIAPERESLESRLLAENWDFPLIVTTNVQLFESLFSSSPSSCRKLHNIANSVIILDEVQTLPLQFLQPVILCLKALVNNFGVTVVFCTATQPALKSFKSVDVDFKGIDNIRELAPNPEELFQKLKRVKVNLPTNLNTKQTWQEIADNLKNHRQVLCIVNTRRDAYELFQLMPEGTIHLSALMCPAHRSKVISLIKQKLKQGDEARVISTQLIEAGVDIDFPVVFRALSGIDNIAQAAGRCNREGKLPNLGELYVFVPPEPSPKGHLYLCEQAGKIILQNYGDPLLPENYTRYYKNLLWTRGKEGLDEYKIIYDMDALKFKQIEKKFRLIDNDGVSVLVPYEQGSEYINTLRMTRDPLKIKEILRKAGPYFVSIPKYSLEKLIQQQSAEILLNSIPVIPRDDIYDQKIGLMLHEPFYYKPESLVL